VRRPIVYIGAYSIVASSNRLYRSILQRSSVATIALWAGPGCCLFSKRSSLDLFFSAISAVGDNCMSPLLLPGRIRIVAVASPCRTRHDMKFSSI
jgi:hypothetical protein